MRNARPSTPLCPITALPAKRRIQVVSKALIIGLWRASFRVSTNRLLSGVTRFELWESSCGLAFFDPMLAGDAAFYDDLYRGGDFHRILAAPGVVRPEFARAAEIIRPGEKVLDVGCGEGGLARHLPHAAYVGLEPNFSVAASSTDVRNETVAAHAGTHPGVYDTVCAFHVIEHVPDPLTFAIDLVECIKPGGRLLIAVPGWPSPITEIPNFVFNAPPHHLSWWSEDALRELAQRLGLIVEAVEPMAFGSHDSVIYWMARFAPKLTGERYFRAHWTWYGALAWSWLGGRGGDALFRVPATAKPSGWLLLARRPSKPNDRVP
jgi:SAM-dependent methyltransferase